MNKNEALKVLCEIAEKIKGTVIERGDKPALKAASSFHFDYFIWADGFILAAELFSKGSNHALGDVTHVKLSSFGIATEHPYHSPCRNDINVSISKSPLSAAKDIERRIIPQAKAAFKAYQDQKGIELAQQNERDIAQRYIDGMTGQHDINVKIFNSYPKTIELRSQVGSLLSIEFYPCHFSISIKTQKLSYFAAKHDDGTLTMDDCNTHSDNFYLMYAYETASELIKVIELFIGEQQHRNAA